MSAPSDGNRLHEKLVDLRRDAIERAEVTVESHLPLREQSVRLSRGSAEAIVAETNISSEVGDEVRADIFDWNERYSLVGFRISSGNLTARLELAADIDVDEQVSLVQYFARLADRLEYEVTEGRDVH